jgi:hypothetical protein
MRQALWIGLLGLLFFGLSGAQDQWDDGFQEFSAGKDRKLSVIGNY